ncbi:MAG: hypothetical protein R3Y23_05030 [Bacillota bacterium]
MAKGKLRRSAEVAEVQEVAQEAVQIEERNKIFQKFELKEIVFIAILSAVLILTCSIMAFVADLTKVIFAIGQVATALQMSFFVTVGLIRVRKVGTVTLIMLFMGAIMVMMSPVMFLSNIFVLLLVELLAIVIFKGYKSDKACYMAGLIIAPLSIITPTVYNAIVYPEIFEAITSNIYMAVGMSAVVVVFGFIGATVGLKVARELIKAGVLK